MHLQWFAAEDEGRTETATERKIREAREEGKVARSAELPSIIVLLFALIILAVLGVSVFSSMIEMLNFFLRSATEIDFVTEQSLFVSVAYRYFVELTAPMLLGVFVAALLGNIVQVGFNFTLKPLTPDFTKIVPRFGQYLRRVMFSAEGLYRSVSMFLKIFAIAALCYLNITANIERFATFAYMPLFYSVNETARMVFILMMEATIVLLVFSLIDYLFQRRQHQEQLMMTRQEVKEERKTEEGDPQVRMRLRKRMQELLSENITQKVPEADVVVTNPTHYAVAVQYDAASMESPMITAKGVEERAKKIREIASEHNVPIIENKALARGLYADVDVGDIIPPEYYRAMATVLQEVYRMKMEER